MGEVESWIGGPADEEALEAVSLLIGRVQPGSMVQRFVLVVEVIDAEDRWLSTFTAPGQKKWDSMGLLDFALTVERNATAVGYDDDED